MRRLRGRLAAASRGSVGRSVERRSTVAALISALTASPVVSSLVSPDEIDVRFIFSLKAEVKEGGGAELVEGSAADEEEEDEAPERRGEGLELDDVEI